MMDPEATPSSDASSSSRDGTQRHAIPWGQHAELVLHAPAATLVVSPLPEGEKPYLVTHGRVETRIQEHGRVTKVELMPREAGFLSLFWRHGGQAELFVPPDVRAKLLLDAGAVRISGLKDCELELNTDAGTASLRDVHGKLTLRTGAGRIIGERVGGTLHVHAAAGAVKNPSPIPIAVSARHVHLDQATLEALFGAGATLTRFRDISQPGQFAAEQKVNLIGPRHRINGVRVLGPLRRSCQVEVSRTDEFTLGIDAPIRDSGNTQGSAPITLEGPAGVVHLKEGLICARRHIHMPPEEAEAYGVSDGDEVEVAVTGGPRDLTFGDVLVRVSPKFKLEMHLDTDEGNAAELNADATGQLVYTEAHGATASLRSRRTPKSEV